MIDRLAHGILRLYPLAFRRRYEPEMRALLDDRSPTLLSLADLLRGAVRAHLRPLSCVAGEVSADTRVRLSASGVLLCWVLFAAAGFGFYKTTEDIPFARAGAAHPLLGDAHAAVQALALVGSAAVLLGAAPLIVLALGRARREPAWRRRTWRAVWPVVAFAGLTAAPVAVAHSGPRGSASTAGHGLAVVWSLAGIAGGVACTLGCRRALLALEVPQHWLRLALSCGTVATAAMGLIATAVAVYAAGLLTDAGSLAAAGNGPFRLISAGASVILQLMAMIAFGALAATATFRGWRGASRAGADCVD